MRRWPIAGLVVLLLAAAVGGVVAYRSAEREPIRSVGSDAARALATAPDPPAVRPAPDPAAPEPAAPIGPPVRIRLPSLDVDAAIVGVGVDSVGDMEIPSDVRTVGWYRHGPPPGADGGSAVLRGHIDDRDQGRGVFFDLGRLAPGDLVQVLTADGQVLDHRVVARERFDKADVPLDRLFDRGGAPRLTLVTCGGAFDRASRNYLDNIVITAVPVAPIDPGEP